MERYGSDKPDTALLWNRQRLRFSQRPFKVFSGAVATGGIVSTAHSGGNEVISNVRIKRVATCSKKLVLVPGVCLYPYG